MATGLRRWWARLTGGELWDREVALLKNTKEDDLPPQGFGQTVPVPNHKQDQVPLSAAEKRERYEEWEGDAPTDPGH